VPIAQEEQRYSRIGVKDSLARWKENERRIEEQGRADEKRGGKGGKGK